LNTTAALDLYAQGRVYFQNFYPDLYAPVYDGYSVELLSGTNFLAQLYVGPLGSQEADLEAVDYPPLPFKSGLLAGYFSGGTYTLAGFAPHTEVQAQVRAWTAISGAAYEEAVQTALRTMVFDHRFGKSNLFSVLLEPEEDRGGDLFGLSPFCIYPPPYTIAATRLTNHLVLAWPAADTNYVLEASETVRSTNWVLVPQLPSVQGDKRVVTEEISGQQKFYRLRRL